MIVDKDIAIEQRSGRATLWADTPAGTRFQVVIDPQYAVDYWLLPHPIDVREFKDAIREHMDEILQDAKAAYAKGKLVLELF